MMPLMVAGAANTTLASFMLAAAIVMRAQTAIRLRAEECDARVAPSVLCRFIFKMPPNVGRKRGPSPTRYCGKTGVAIIGCAYEPRAMGGRRCRKNPKL